MEQVKLEQIYKKLDEIDNKLSALLVPEEKASASELRAIKRGQKEFSQGKFVSLSKIKAKADY